MVLSVPTVLVLLVAGLLLFFGALLLGFGSRRSNDPACPQCLHRNPAGSRFCGQCGHKLRD